MLKNTELLFFHILIASEDATANCYAKNSTTETILKCNWFECSYKKDKNVCLCCIESLFLNVIDYTFDQFKCVAKLRLI